MDDLLGSTAPGKAARNEVRKLKAFSLNSVGAAGFGVAALGPLFSGDFSAATGAKVAIASALWYSLFLSAAAALSHLED